MSRPLKLFLIIIISIIAIIACGLLFLFLYNRANNTSSIEGGCCTCIDCPYCDMCCDCSNPYLNKK